MKVIQQPVFPTNILSIPMSVPHIQTSHLLESTSNKKPSTSLEQLDQNIIRITKIIELCYPYAKEIDIVTHRKNCSKNVAEFVYKISQYLGYSEYDSMIYYAVGLIYDIGFLNIDPTILNKSEINEKEFDIIKTHTTLGLNTIHFIDNELKPTFQEGILKHHENLDGTGYPKGISKNEIPYIARVIRVVESFFSLISKRKYKKIINIEQAINELYKSKKKYDKKIIDALNNII
jgi:HD-GYP domain-containing protein (c-di-GMP phosphodiesterase class II)